MKAHIVTLAWLRMAFSSRESADEYIQSKKNKLVTANYYGHVKARPGDFFEEDVK